jgi:plastocyanin
MVRISALILPFSLSTKRDPFASKTSETMRRILVLLLFAPATLMASDLFIPAAGRLVGANNTFFRSDLRIVNLSSDPATVDLTFLPSNSDNSGAAPLRIPLPSRGSTELDDIVGRLFGLTSGSGAIRLSSAAGIAVSSRTYTTSITCPGTFGQFIPALDLASAFTRSVIPDIELSADPTVGFRTNIGLLNPSFSSVEVTLRLRSGDGASLGTAQLTLLPLEQAQNSAAAFFSLPALTATNAFLEITSNAPVFAFASVVDNESGDPIYLTAQNDVGTPSSTLSMTAQRWVFEPSTLTVTAGQKVTLQIRSTDVEHGISFSGVGPVSCSSNQGGECLLRPTEVVTVSFTPLNRGTFAFFCTRFCGDSADGTTGHATMRGTLIVN